MRRSEYFLPIIKDVPAEARVVSHRLMLRAGLIRQTSAGIYAWLPLGLRVLKKVEQVVRSEQDAAGAQEILMPTIQPADIWRKGGRYDDYGKEMLRFSDRQGREMLYGPTNEEMISDIFRSCVHSYRELPKNLYHIQWKFRDELRPRFGVMRGREFLMKDAYSFDLDVASSHRAYHTMFLAYLRTFAKMGLRAVPMRAESGVIGGDMSHEFVILAATGESEVFCHHDWMTLEVLRDAPGYDGDLSGFFHARTGLYAATQDKHDPATCPVEPELLTTSRGIEVGHIFHFGTKYSKPMGVYLSNARGEQTLVEMGSYGIGVSRLVGALIEANHDQDGIIWPLALAPFTVGLISLAVEADSWCWQAYQALGAAGAEVLYDDRHERPGVKFAEMDLIGLPWQMIIGPRGLQSEAVELKHRATGQRQELSFESAINHLIKQVCKRG